MSDFPLRHKLDWPRASVAEGLILDPAGVILDKIRYFIFRERAVGSWQLEVSCAAPKGPQGSVETFHLPVRDARRAELALYPKLAEMLVDLDGRIEGRRRFLARLAGGDFEVSRRVAASREYSPHGSDFGGLWQSTGGQFQYFVSGVRGLGPILDKGECRERVTARAQELLAEFDRLVAADEVEAALKLAKSL